MRYSGLWDIIPKDNKNFWWSWPKRMYNRAESIYLNVCHV